MAVLADTRINAILVRSASPARMNLAKSLIARLDQPSSEPGNIRVVYLRNAEATRLVQVLRGVLVGDSGVAGGQFGAPGQGGAFGANPQTGAFGQFDRCGDQFPARGVVAIGTAARTSAPRR